MTKEYYVKHKARIAARKAWQQKHDLHYRLRALLRSIIQRCNDPRHATYAWYGGKGVKNFLTLDDLKFLWERDGAALMKWPTIDRRDGDGHYEHSNCSFIEHADNLKRSWKKTRRVVINNRELIWIPTPEL